MLVVLFLVVGGDKNKKQTNKKLLCNLFAKVHLGLFVRMSTNDYNKGEGRENGGSYVNEWTGGS